MSGLLPLTSPPQGLGPGDKACVWPRQPGTHTSPGEAGRVRGPEAAGAEGQGRSGGDEGLKESVEVGEGGPAGAAGWP